MTGKKAKGFTLIEVIVVIAIIGVLAAIIVPTMLGYVRLSRMRHFNSNAASVFKGAQLAAIDIVNNGRNLPVDDVFISDGEDMTSCTSSGDQNFTLDIADYVGNDFKGSFGFMTNSEGSGCLYAMWSDEPITAAMLQNQMSENDVKDCFYTGSSSKRGCHPLKAN